MNEKLTKIIEETYRQGKENAGHIKIINGEMGELRDEQKNLNDKVEGVCKDVVELKVDISKVKTDVGWVKKFQWIIITTSIASLIGIIIKFFLDR